MRPLSVFPLPPPSRSVRAQTASDDLHVDIRFVLEMRKLIKDAEEEKKAMAEARARARGAHSPGLKEAVDVAQAAATAK